MDVTVPDIGDFTSVPVIEVLVKPGDRVKKDDSLIALESEKASMEIPSPSDGTVGTIAVKVGDKVAQGALILTLVQDAASATAVSEAPVKPAPVTAPTATPAATPAASPTEVTENVASSSPSPGASTSSTSVHAGPAVRRFARELGVDLAGIQGSGPNARITREDVQSTVKRSLQANVSSGDGTAGIPGLPPWPKVDFAAFGPIERKPLSRIKKLSGSNLHRNWVRIPHITNYDEADITELDAFRNQVNAEQNKGGIKLTLLAFLIKAVVAGLQKFPDFNASLDGDDLVYKNYYNIGFAADTPNGLLVPVLKGARDKGLLDIARETAELAGKARDGKLALADMQGGTFTISSIGGIGGTQFTQIVNAPEVAIVGATRSAIRPMWDGQSFVPRLMLPVSVSYDHRVIDGAGAARFLVYVTGLLRDFRRVLL